jgi:hypothetical protein
MRTLATAFATCVLIAPAAVWGQLTATPNPLNFNVPTGAGLTPQNVNVTFNGSPVTITGVSASTTTGQNWLQLFVTGVLGTLTVSTNPLGLSEGTYTGTAFVATTVGSIAVQVNLNVGGATPPGIPAPPSLILTLTGLAGAGLYQARRIYSRRRGESSR